MDQDELNWFTNQMADRLKANYFKPGWKNSPYDHLLNKLISNMYHLTDNITANNTALAIQNCVDMANFAMMIASNIGYEPLQRIPLTCRICDKPLHPLSNHTHCFPEAKATTQHIS